MTISFFKKIHPERIIKAGKKMVNDLDYVDIKFLSLKKIIVKLNKRNNICIIVFSYENDLVYPVYVLDKKNLKIT